MDLERWAKINGITPEEFKVGIFEAAAALGSMDLDESGASKEDAMKFTTSGDGPKVEVYVRYAD